MQNLWPEFDKEQSLSESAGHDQQRISFQRRRPTEQAILSSLRDWLLHDYIVPYCRSLAATRIFRRCYWIDGIGGRPILQSIVSITRLLAKESKPITLYTIVLDARSTSRKEANASNSFTLPEESGIVHASWPDIASPLLQAIDQSAAIFLLNPFAGLAPFSYGDLAPLYQRTAPTELCLLISHRQVETRLLPFLSTSAGASAFTTLLHNDRWKALLANGTEAKSLVDGLINALLASMQQHRFLSVQRIALLMQVAPAVVESVPYTLIFATRRQDSLISMNDAVCNYRRRLHEQSHQGVLTEEWFVAQQRERLMQEIQQLYQLVLRQGRSQRQRRWPDLRQQVLIANFGQFTLQDYDQIICQLLQRGEVRCEWRQKLLENPDPEECRIPGNDDTLLWK
jgi:hypothetical protein